jgi:hypothetical protein
MNPDSALDSELPVVVSFVTEADMGLLSDIEHMVGSKIEQLPFNVAELFSSFTVGGKH